MASEFDSSGEEEEIEDNADERSVYPSPEELILSFNQEEDEIREGYGCSDEDGGAEAISVVPISAESPVSVSGFDEEEGGQLNSRPNFHVNDSYKIDDDCNREAVQRTSFTSSSSSDELPAVANGFDEEEGIEEFEESGAACIVPMVSSKDESRAPGAGSGEAEQEIERVDDLRTNGTGLNSEGISGERNRPTVNTEKEELELNDELMPEGTSHVLSGLHGGETQFREEGGEFDEETSSGILLGLESPEIETQDESSSGIFLRDNSEQEFEAASSPSSSGYAGERGSSTAASASESGDSIQPYGDEENIEIRPFSDSERDPDSNRVPGKRHLDEDDASLSWRKRKKHFIILSNSGKPIYSRYGDEHKLAGFSATLQAIISFMENGGDHVKFVRAGNHQVIFLVKGPIYLVCISCTDEPYEALRRQLDLIYGQMLVILTKSVNRCFEKNPKFDMTPLLGGTDMVFSSLIHFFSRNPATFLHAYTCLPLAYSTRQAAGAILQDVADSGVLFAILMCKHKVISLVGAQKASLHPDDMLLLSNFVLSSESFRTSESFSPICLPRYNPMAFLYAYVAYLDMDTYLMLLTTSSDAFYHLRDCRIRIENVLLKSNVLSEVQRSELDGGLRVEDLPVDSTVRSGTVSPHLRQEKSQPDSSEAVNAGVGGPDGLWHFMYRSIYLDQYVASEFSSPLEGHKQKKRLYRAYQRLYASMHDKLTGPHKTQFRRDENYVLLCWITPDFELYAAFDPLSDKATAINVCNRVCQWVRDVENEIFLLGASPFSW